LEFFRPNFWFVPTIPIAFSVEFLFQHMRDIAFSFEDHFCRKKSFRFGFAGHSLPITGHGLLIAATNQKVKQNSITFSHLNVPQIVKIWHLHEANIASTSIFKKIFRSTTKTQNSIF